MLNTSLFRRPKRSRVCTVVVDGNEIRFAIERDPGDPISQALADGNFPRDAVSNLWRHLITPGQTVVDVGAHVGLYSLPAAVGEATVVAIEGSARNAELLRYARTINKVVSNLHVHHAVASEEGGTIDFWAHGPYGHVRAPGDGSTEGVRETPAVLLDDLLRALASPALVKIDVEGSELRVLAGLTNLLSREQAPPLLVEANGHMLHEFHYKPSDVVGFLENRGYKCHWIDPNMDEQRLVPVSAEDLQPECVSDYIAFKRRPDNLAPWSIDEPFSRAEVVERLVKTCNSGTGPEHWYGARLLDAARSGNGPAWLLENARIAQLIRAYTKDSFTSSADDSVKLT